MDNQQNRFASQFDDDFMNYSLFPEELLEEKKDTPCYESLLNVDFQRASTLRDSFGTDRNDYLTSAQDYDPDLK